MLWMQKECFSSPVPSILEGARKCLSNLWWDRNWLPNSSSEPRWKASLSVAVPVLSPVLIQGTLKPLKANLCFLWLRRDWFQPSQNYCFAPVLSLIHGYAISLPLPVCFGNNALVFLCQVTVKGCCCLLVEKLSTAWEFDSGIASEILKKPKQWLFPLWKLRVSHLPVAIHLMFSYCNEPSKSRCLFMGPVASMLASVRFHPLWWQGGVEELLLHS